mgnify:CR=1 FL=1
MTKEQMAVIQIKSMINSIVEEGPEDVAAWEWRAHLQDVLRDLESGRLSVEEASDELGVRL